MKKLMYNSEAVLVYLMYSSEAVLVYPVHTIPPSNAGIFVLFCFKQHQL